MAYNRYTLFIVFFVFLVVLAGGIVRTTQSGMGCPDWPKCFGMWIPPVEESQLPADFEKYLSKQDIDHTFNVYHTWVEYINRLLGALLGLFILIHFVWTFIKRKQVGTFVLSLSFLMVVMVAFTGWLGKVVVDNNLAVFKITLHMLSALALAVVPIYILRLLDFVGLRRGNYSWGLLFLFTVMLLIQLYMGTVVREEIDLVSKELNYGMRHTWIEQLSSWFNWHRSFSWVIMGVSLLMLYKSGFAFLEKIFSLMVILLFIIGVGFVYGNFPAFLQPLHLLISLLLISLCISSLFPSNKRAKVV